MFRPLRLTLCLGLLIALPLMVAPCVVYGAEHGAPSDKKDVAKSKKREASTITGGTTADEPIYLHLAPVTFPIIDDNGAQQIVSLLVDLRSKEREKAEKMQANMPRLKDAMLQALYSGMSDGTMRNSHMINIEKIKESIMDTVNRIFGEGHVTEVLIQAVSQRKL